MHQYSGIPHGSIPRDEHIERDGKIYYPISGPLRNIKEDVHYHKHKPWGFLIYRCDYTSDDLWEKFMSNLRYDVEEWLLTIKAHDLKDALEMTPVENKKTLDGATVDQVRDLFKDWVKSDEARNEMGQGAPCGAFKSPRYTYCVHVDVDVMDSVVNRAPQPPIYDTREIGYVNMVQLRFEDFVEEARSASIYWKMYWRIGRGNSTEESDDEWEDVEEDEDFVKVPLGYLGAEAYNKLYDPFTWERYLTYRREDDVSYGGGALNPHGFFKEGNV
jgi:hypothetical protein